MARKRNDGKISLSGGTVKVSGFMNKVRDGGHAVSREAYSLDLPGTKPVDLCPDGLQAVVDRLLSWGESGNAGEIFARTATEDSEGNLSGYFAEGARVRRVTVPAAEREEFAEFLTGLIDSWDDNQARIAEAQAQADAEAAKAAGAPTEEPAATEE